MRRTPSRVDRTRAPRPTAALLAALLAGVPVLGGLAGCGGDDAAPAGSSDGSPSAAGTGEPADGTSSDRPTKASGKPTAEPAAQTVAITLEGDSVTPEAERLDVRVGERVDLVVTSDRVGELHVHSTPEQSFEVRPGTETFEVRFSQPGQVDIEEHESGVLVVRMLVR